MSTFLSVIKSFAVNLLILHQKTTLLITQPSRLATANTDCLILLIEGKRRFCNKDVDDHESSYGSRVVCEASREEKKQAKAPNVVFRCLWYGT